MAKHNWQGKMCVPKASWHQSIFMFSLSLANDVNLQMVDAESKVGVELGT